jgi:hypothetical protein
MHGFACGPVRRIGGMVVSFFWDLGSTAWLFFLFSDLLSFFFSI